MNRLRSERPGDAAAIDEILREAFDGDDEVALVRKLRGDGALALSLVAEENASIVGHIAFEPLEIDPDPGFPCWALAPLAVRRSLQRRGIGAALVREGLAQAARRGVGFVAVLGEPSYYRRFGFEVALADGLQVAWAGPHFMGLALPGGGKPRGTAIYPRAFG